MTSRLVRGQLLAFGALAMVALVVVSLQYLQVPQLLNWGRMQVSAQLPSTGGLSKNSLVTYRGVTVGKVAGLQLSPGGVVADLRVDTSPPLPANVTAQVHSTSAIGEQYLELRSADNPVAAGGAGPAGTAGSAGPGALLAPGARIPAVAKNPVPVDAGTLLASVNSLITSLDPADLRVTVDELDTAFSGAGSSLATLLDGGSSLISEAQQNLDATRSLIANLEPVLRTQKAAGPDIVAISSNLADFTGELKLSDKDLRALIQQGPAAQQITALVNDVHPALPMVLANLGATGQVLRVYLPGIKQVLVLYPALTASLQSLVLGGPEPGESKLYFRLNINEPTGCRTGFTGKRREPSETSDPTKVNNGYCKAGPTSDLAVRGARNSPCPNGGRAATAAGCGLDFTRRPAVTMTSYDPITGAFTGPDGKPYTIDLDR